MKSVPDAVFVIDTRREAIAVAEARKLKIPVIGVLDTNSDPDEVDVPIPGNDDALRAIRLFAGRVADAVLAGRGVREAHLAEQIAGGAEAPARRPARAASRLRRRPSPDVSPGPGRARATSRPGEPTNGPRGFSRTASHGARKKDS